MLLKNGALPCSLAVAGLLYTTSPGAAQVVGGTVLDSASARPVTGAHVVLLAPAGSMVDDRVTGADGAFMFRLPGAGDYLLRVSRLGYSTKITQPIGVDSTFAASVKLWLAPNAVPLDTLTIVAERIVVEKQLSFLVDAGFYDRQRMGFGYFFVRAQIDTLHPRVMSDMFYGLSRVQVVCRRLGLCDLLTSSAGTMFIRRSCSPSVVLDGLVLRVGGDSRGLWLDELFDPFNVEAIEVYPSPAGVPVQYAGYMSPCGAIIAWSRR